MTNPFDSSQDGDRTTVRVPISELGEPSRVAVNGHPLHPMAAPFPIALLVAALGTDLGFWITDDIFWARASYWLLGAGILTGIVAAGLGAVDFAMIRRVRQLGWAWIHGVGNVLALILAIINIWLRWDHTAAFIVPIGFLLSVITVFILAITAWGGGELVFRHGIGRTR